MSRVVQIVLGACLTSALAVPASATTFYMSKLPTSSTFRCLNCHSTQDPVTPAQGASLNSFGAAFKNNSFRWDRTLAQVSSDGDRCTNAFELGDEDFDGRPDANVSAERSNPGQNDCTLQITQQAWSNLKVLFRP